MLLRELPLDGEIWSRRGSMKGVKEEEDLCLDMELLSDCDWERFKTFREQKPSTCTSTKDCYSDLSTEFIKLTVTVDLIYNSNEAPLQF